LLTSAFANDTDGLLRLAPDAPTPATHITARPRSISGQTGNPERTAAAVHTRKSSSVNVAWCLRAKAKAPFLNAKPDIDRSGKSTLV
jgi:hypothetical protein